MTRADLDFINGDDIDYDDDIDFYWQTSKKLLLDEVPAVKDNVRNLRIESDSESDYRTEVKEEFKIPNSEQVEFPEGTKIIIPESMRSFYGSEDYEWNYFKLPEGDVYEFPKEDKCMKLFIDTLFMATKINGYINKEKRTHERRNSANILST